MSRSRSGKVMSGVRGVWRSVDYDESYKSKSKVLEAKGMNM